MATGNGVPSNVVGMTFGDPDMWDDRELIESYDKAVRSWRKRRENEDNTVTETPGPGPWREVGAQEQTEAVAVDTQPVLSAAELFEVGSWIVGAPCRALYSEDGQEYEAKIVGIEGPSCIVRYIGYGNEEQVNLLDLKTTHGKHSRAKQRRDAFEFHQNASGRSADAEEIADRVSNVSVSSSMYNNYTDSVCHDGELEDTLTEMRHPLQASTPARSAILTSASKQTSNYLAKMKMARASTSSLPSNSVITVDSAMPSCAEATIDSSSEVSSIAEEVQQTPVNLANGDWENFNNTMPQFRFPVPPMPLSLSNKEGAFDFSRGELPSLLMSWYMAGYQAGFFDAKNELSQKSGRSGGKQDERMNGSMKASKQRLD